MARTTLESLPDDLVLKILVENLSAEDIHDSARLVCRKWYHMTKTPSFAYSHLQNNTEYALLFMNKYGLDDPVSLSLRNGGVETSELRKTVGDWFFVCGCNGLLLSTLSCSDDGILYIVNPVTKQGFLLPQIPRIYPWKCSISYAAASMVYKAVVCRLGLTQNWKWVLLYSIFTVGVDKFWRPVCEAELSSKALSLVTEGGFLHLCDSFLEDNKVLTMDVETEIIRETPPPFFSQMYKEQSVFLSTGKYLTFLVCCGEYLWEVWEMKPQTGEWRNVAMLSLDAWKGMFERIGIINNQHLAPIGWLKYPDVLVFGFSGGSRVFPYNLVTQELKSIQLPPYIFVHTPFIHCSSLIWV